MKQEKKGIGKLFHFRLLRRIQNVYFLGENICWETLDNVMYLDNFYLYLKKIIHIILKA